MSKKLLFLMLNLIGFMMINTTSISTTLSSNRVISAFHKDGISLEVSAPYRAYPDGRITIITNLNTSESIRHFTFYMIVNGCKIDGYGNWSEPNYIYKDRNFDAGIWPTVSTDIDIPHDITPYMVYCFAKSSWHAEYRGTGENSSKSLYIEIIYLENVDYENLQNRYDVLQAEFITTRTLMNALGVTLLIFIGTTIYLTIEKRETKPK
jgi:hypothetical protein